MISKKKEYNFKLRQIFQSPLRPYAKKKLVMLMIFIILIMFINSLNSLPFNMQKAVEVQKNIPRIYINRIATITLVVVIYLILHTINFQTIGKGIGIFSGFFQITIFSLCIEIFLFLIGIGIFSG